MGRESSFPEYFKWNNFSLSRPSSHKATAAWAIIRAIYDDLQACFVLCQSLIEAIENTPAEKTAPAIAAEVHNEPQNNTPKKAQSTIAKLLKYFSPWLSEMEPLSTGPHGDETYKELKSLSESIVKGANSISFQLSRRQRRPGWRKGEFAERDEFDGIVRELKGNIVAPMQKSVHNKNSSLPTTEQVKEWSDKIAGVVTDTLHIIKKDQSTLISWIANTQR